MNFTREPIIETVITPREGYKLLIRRSKASSEEEYMVESVEVISFGSALFFRSLDRMRSFLVPVGDYEVLERREQKMVLKTPVIEKSIKIAGGNTFIRKEETLNSSDEEEKSDRRDKRKGRKGRKPEKIEKEPMPYQQQEVVAAPAVVEEQVSPAIIRKLIPPPTKLIKDHMSRYRQFDDPTKEIVSPEEVTYPEPLVEIPPLPEEKKEAVVEEKFDM